MKTKEAIRTVVEEKLGNLTAKELKFLKENIRIHKKKKKKAKK
jgi:hypothetical protein